MLVASYPFSVSAASEALRRAGSRDRSSRPVVRWRSFDSVARISFDPVGYMPCHVDCSADSAVLVSYRGLLGYRSGGGFGLEVVLAGLAEGFQWPPEPSSQRRGHPGRHERAHDEVVDQQAQSDA